MNVDCLMEIASNKASKQLSFDLRNYDLYYENMPRHSDLALMSRDHMFISCTKITKGHAKLRMHLDLCFFSERTEFAISFIRRRTRKQKDVSKPPKTKHNQNELRLHPMRTN